MSDTVCETTADMCGADITQQEVEKVASRVPLNKSPGPDRIPNGFWRAFSEKTSKLLAAAFNEAKNTGKFIPNFNDGIVAILFKKGERSDIRNYRPITLLNGDYKILTRIFAKRMLSVVSQFV